MSNIRAKIIEALKKEPMTISDLSDACKSATRKQIVDAASHAAKDGLITKGRCDITNEPLYSLTHKGRGWVPTKPGANLRKALEKPMAMPQPEGKENAPNPPEDSQKVASPAHGGLIAGICEASGFGADRPLGELDGHIKALKALAETADSLRAEVKRLKETGCAGYAIAFPGEIYPTPAAAIAELLADVNDIDAVKVATVVAVRPVGKIAMKPVLVPMDEAA